MIDSSVRQLVSPLTLRSALSQSFVVGQRVLTLKASSPRCVHWSHVVAITPKRPRHQAAAFQRQLASTPPNEPHYSRRPPNHSHCASLCGRSTSAVFSKLRCVHLVINGVKMHVAAMSSAVCMILTILKGACFPAQNSFQSFMKA